MKDVSTYQITAPHFVAGFTVTLSLLIKDAAPIIAYMKGLTLSRVSMYCQKKGWKLEKI